tara:strand:- start:3819 stop:4025 length:207 start_codon:yes stop_codon:yes gene_type:complete
MKSVNIGSVEMECIDMNDYPDFCDAYISFAEYEDGEILSDAELEDLQSDIENNGDIWEIINNQLCRNF